VIEWIAKTNKDRLDDPPKPEEYVENGLRSKVAGYTEFADRMIRAVYGKSSYSPSSSTVLFDDLISPSQEAFALLLYNNGYENWVWMNNNACMTSDGSDATTADGGGGGRWDVLVIDSQKGQVTSRAGMEVGRRTAFNYTISFTRW
jgi:hypothetical protein